MNPCRDWEDRLWDGVVEALGPEEARELEKHIEGCPSCAAAYAALRARQGRLKAAVGQIVSGAQPSAGFHARLVRAVESESIRPRPFRLSWAAALAGGAAVAIALVAPRPTGPWRRGPEGGDALSGAEALLSWRSPTAVLLRSPADSLLREAPSLGGFAPLEPAPTDTETGERHDS
jgi:hypothetical protein